MTEQRFVAFLLAIIALSHAYLLYPLPSSRVEEIIRIEMQKNQQNVIADSKRSGTVATEQTIRTNLELDALETSLWQGWRIALAVVGLGIVSAAMVWTLRSPLWHAVALSVCIAYLVMFWIEAVPPLHNISDFVEFQAKTVSSLIRHGYFSRLLMLTQQLLAPVLFLIIGVYVAMRISRGAKR